MSGLNWDKNFALEQAADDAELLQELLDIFKESCANDIALIKSGLDSQDSSQVRGAAHSIKGAAASLGILGIRDLAMSIELDARDGGLGVAQEKIAQLEALSRELLSIQ